MDESGDIAKGFGGWLQRYYLVLTLASSRVPHFRRMGRVSNSEVLFTSQFARKWLPNASAMNFLVVFLIRKKSLLHRTIVWERIGRSGDATHGKLAQIMQSGYTLYALV